MTDRFVLRFTNVVCPREGETFPDRELAIDRGRDAGFEFTVWSETERPLVGHPARLVASWTVFGGLKLVG